jgi:signal peptidase II
LKVLIISAVIIIADQLSKIFIKGASLPWLNIYTDGITPGVRYPLLADSLNITLIENPGFAFGIYPGSEYKIFLTIVTLFITAGLAYHLYKSANNNLTGRIATALLLGGAAGNLIDRVFYGVMYDYAPYFYGNVVDFINIKFNSSLLPGNLSGNYVFNIADIAITTGLILIVFSFDTSKSELKSLAAENQE